MILILWAGAWLVAMATVALWDAPWWLAGVCVALLLPLTLLRLGRHRWWIAGGCVALALLGGLRLSEWEDRPPPALAARAGDEVTLTGTVASDGAQGLRSARYRVDAFEADGQPTSGGVLVYLNQYAEYLPGDVITVEGELEAAEPFDGFDYPGYLSRRGIVGTMLFPEVEFVRSGSDGDRARVSAKVRGRLVDSLNGALPEPEASLAAGIAFGADATLDAGLEDDFRTVGLTHILAVSGANMTILAGMVFVVFVPLIGRRWAVLPAAVAIALYLLAAGLSPSVTRAAIMAAIFLLGAAIGRPQAGLPALALAALIMTALNPAIVFDAGFQLSLAATAGIIVFSPWLTWAIDRALERTHAGGVIPSWAVATVSLSLSATVATLPIVWVTFGRVSLVGIAANLMVEPVFAIAFILSLLTALAGVAWEPLGWAIGLVAFYPLVLIVEVARLLSSVPFAAIDVPGREAESAALALALLAVPGWLLYRRLAPARVDRRRDPSQRTMRRLTWATAFGCLAIAAVPLSLAPMRGPGELQVTALDVGQGDAILVTTPGGHHVLVDGGPSGLGVLQELGDVLPHWQRSLDTVVVTHPDEDHIAGLAEVLARFHVDTVYATGRTHTTDSYRAFRSEADEIDTLAEGSSFTVDGVRFDILWPPPDYDPSENNATSIVLRLTYGDTTVLLTGDIGAAEERALVDAYDLRADVLKVPHHGSKDATNAFFDEVHASVAVISVGAGNPYGHPTDETLAALGDAITLRTDLDGRVTIRSDGERISVRTER